MLRGKRLILLYIAAWLVLVAVVAPALNWTDNAVLPWILLALFWAGLLGIEGVSRWVARPR